MKQLGRWRKILILVVAFGLSACGATGKKQYDISMESKQAGNYREAITYLEEAITAEPQNEKYRYALTELKDKLIRQLVSEGENALRSETPLTITAFNRAKAKLSESEQVDPTHPVVIEFSARLQKEEQALLKGAQDYYSQAKRTSIAGNG